VLGLPLAVTLCCLSQGGVKYRSPIEGLRDDGEDAGAVEYTPLSQQLNSIDELRIAKKEKAAVDAI